MENKVLVRVVPYKNLNFLLLKALILAFLVLGLSVFKVMAATSNCYDLEGSTTQILPPAPPIMNEGEMDFDLVGAPLDPQYKACLQSQEDYSSKQILLKGWVWNLNLGWVSLNSSDETGDGINPYENLGLNTGDYAYDSYLDLSTAADFEAGDYTGSMLTGYWWGDNLGWLSLSCGPVGDPACLASDYRVTVDSLVGSGTDLMGNLSGYAWSSAHGWVNMDGVQIPLGYLYAEYIPQISLVPTKVEGLTYTDIDEFDLNDDPVVRAGGESGYKMVIGFEDANGNPVAAGALPDAYELCFIWDDKRYLDFENPEDIPLEQTDCFESTDSTAEVYGSPDKSIKLNALTGGDFYELGDYYVLKPSKFINSNVPAGVGEFSLDKVVAGNQTYDLVNKDLIFKPPYELRLFQENLEEGVDCLTHEVQANYLDATLGFNDAFSACGEYFQVGMLSSGLEVKLAGEISSLDGSDLQATFFDAEEDPIFCDTFGVDPEGEEFLIAAHNWLNIRDQLLEFSASTMNLRNYKMHLGFFDYQTALDEGSPCEYVDEANLEIVDSDAVIDEAEVDLIAEYSYLDTSSFTNALVRRKGAVLEKSDFSVSAAELSGNIQGDAIQIFKDNSALSSGGDSTRSAQRKAIVQDVTEIAKGIGFNCRFDTFDEYEELASSYSTCEVGDTGLYVIEFTKEYVSSLVGTDNKLPIVYYSNLPDSFKSGDKTLVLVGTSLYLDEQVFNSDDPNEAKGIVALKNTVNTGGHVYIDSEVTDIRAHIYTDGTIYSIDSVNALYDADSVTGLPAATYSLDKSSLRNQLYISGQITSQNTYGGALLGTPRLGDGTVVQPSEIDKAKWQDINFWRYSPVRLDIQTNAADEEEIHLCGQPEDWLMDDGINYDVAGYLLAPTFFTGGRGDRQNFVDGIIPIDNFNMYFEFIFGGGLPLPLDYKDKFKCWPEGDASKRLAEMYAGARYGVSPVMIKYALPPADLPLFN